MSRDDFDEMIANYLDQRNYVGRVFFIFNNIIPFKTATQEPSGASQWLQQVPSNEWKYKYVTFRILEIF